MHVMRYRTYKNEQYLIDKETDSHYSVMLVGARSGKVKRQFAVSETPSGLSCNGRRCKAHCTHVKIVHTLMEKPAMLTVVPQNTEVLPTEGFTTAPHRFSLALERLKLAVEELRFGITVTHREIEDLSEALYVIAQDEHRERAIYESIWVFENFLNLIHERKFQCGRCVLHRSCVRNERQGMQCLAYFLFLDYANEREFYENIPLDSEVLYAVDFHTLLIMSIIHEVNFQTLEHLSAEGLRQRLLKLNDVSKYALIA